MAAIVLSTPSTTFLIPGHALDVCWLSVVCLTMVAPTYRSSKIVLRMTNCRSKVKREARGFCIVLRFQFAFKKLRSCGIDLQPAAMAQEVVDLVGDDAFLDLQTVKAADEIDGLVDANVAIIVAVDK